MVSTDMTEAVAVPFSVKGMSQAAEYYEEVEK